METYTFSRALHMMRYGGKKMKPIAEGEGYWITVENNQLIGHCINSASVVLDENNIPSWITHKDIMGSWVEVKE